MDTGTEYEKIEEESVEVITDTPKEYPVTDKDDFYQDHPFKTQHVIDRLGIPRQTVINYSNFYEEILDLKKSPGGDRMFSEKCIKQLAFILTDKDVSRRNNPQELQYLKTMYGSKNMELATGGTEALTKFFSDFQAAVLQSMEESQKRNQQELIEYFSQKEKKLEDAYAASADYEKRLDEQAERYSSALQKREDEIEQLKVELEKTKAELAEKNKPFSFLKRKK